MQRLLTSISTDAREKAESVRKAAEDKGFVLTGAEYEALLQYTARKCEVNGKGEDYLPLLLADEIKDYFFRNAINATTLLRMATA